MIKLISANTTQALLILKNDGTLVNKGPGAKKWINVFKDRYILVPTRDFEGEITITQNTLEGIELIIKGKVSGQISDPEQAARIFDFNDPKKTERTINEIITRLNEKTMYCTRDELNRISMKDAMEKRRTLVSRIVSDAVMDIVSGGTGMSPWGMTVNCEIQQVFPKDPKVMQQIGAEALNSLRKSDQLSAIEADREIDMNRLNKEKEIKSRMIDDERETEEKRLDAERDTEKKKIDIQRLLQKERFVSRKQELERDNELAVITEENNRIAAGERQKTRELELKMKEEALVIEKGVLVREAENREINTASRVKARFEEVKVRELEVPLAPLEDLPDILSRFEGIFRGARLHLYDGAETGLLKPLHFMVESFTNSLEMIREKKKKD